MIITQQRAALTTTALQNPFFLVVGGLAGPSKHFSESVNFWLSAVSGTQRCKRTCWFEGLRASLPGSRACFGLVCAWTGQNRPGSRAGRSAGSSQKTISAAQCGSSCFFVFSRFLYLTTNSHVFCVFSSRSVFFCI